MFRPDYGKYLAPTNRVTQSKTFIPEQKIRSDDIAKLFNVILNGDINTISKTMIENHLNGNVYDSDKNSLLHILINSTYPVISEEKKLEIIKFLINKGAHVNSVNIYGVTPIHLAASRNYPTIIKLLITKGAYINVNDSDNKTPLHYVIQNSLVECKALYPDNEEPKLIEYEQNKIEFKEINNLMIKLFSEDNFNKYLVDFANTINFYIGSNGDIKSIIEKMVLDIKKESPKYVNNIEGLTMYVNSEHEKVITGLKQTIINKMEIGKNIIFGSNEDKNTIRLDEMDKSYMFKRNGIINSMGKTLTEMKITSNKFIKDYTDNISKNVKKLEKTFNIIKKINENVQKIFVHHVELDTYSPSTNQAELERLRSDAENYHGSIVRKYEKIILGQPEDLERDTIKLVDMDIDLNIDSVNNRFGHTKLIIEYVDAFIRVLDSIYIEKNNEQNLYSTYTNFIAQSIPFILNTVMALSKLHSFIPTIKNYNKQLNEFIVETSAAKKMQDRLLLVVNRDNAVIRQNLDAENQPPVFDIYIVNLVNKITNLVNEYKRIKIKDIVNAITKFEQNITTNLGTLYESISKYHKKLNELTLCLNTKICNMRIS